MTSMLPSTGLQLRSTITSGGVLELTLVDEPVIAPGFDEVLIRVEATPINPSDQGLLFGAADLSTLSGDGTDVRPFVRAKVPERAMRAMAGRADQSMPVGNEGAGVVIASGDSPEAKALMGKVVAVLAGSMYSQYRTVKASQCLVLPPGTTPAEGASCFVNPLTALGMTETMRREGHRALVHTAAASNLGQILIRICLADGIELVNIVRNAEQEQLLRGIGAPFVCNSNSATFVEDLTDALVATGATIAFDAIGGGRLASKILTCMEAALNRTAKEYSRYGTTAHKQVYIYGGLDTGRPTPKTQRGHVLGRGRLAAVSVPAEDRTTARRRAAPARGQRIEDHVRKRLLAGNLIDGSPAAEGHRGLQQAGDRDQVRDQSPSVLRGP